MASSYRARLRRQNRRYAEKELALLAVRPPSKDGAQSGKAPLTGHGHKDAVLGRRAVQNLFALHPDANVAAATGSRSNLLVLDVDGPKGRKNLRKLEKKLGELPNTWTSKTGGGGRHLFFKWPKGLALTRDTAGKLIGPKVDVLGEGSYAVLPPSRHRSGAAYAWIGDGVDGELAEFPFEWRRHLRRQLKKRTASVSTEGTAADNIAVGARNSTLFALASSWRAKGDDEAALLKKLVEVNAIRCKPPLPADELQRIASSASKHAIESDKTDLPTLVAEATLDQGFAQGWHLQAHEGRFYFYDGTHWRPLTDDQLKKAALSALATISTGKKVKTAGVLNEIVTILRAKQASVGDPFFDITTPPPIINVRNGELHIQPNGSVELKPHSPDSGQRQTMPVDYDPNAVCPQYDEALDQIFSKSSHPAELVRHWHELAGYILQPTRLHPTIVVMLGSGSNGKTKLVETILELMGSESAYCGLVHELETNRFAIGALRGKSIFVDDDVKTRVKLPDGTLKKISEGKRLTGEEKFKNAATFNVRTVPVLLCNNIPLLQDVSHGMLRRLHILPFQKRFEGDEKDETLFPRIWAQELPGILNHFLAGWRRLQTRGCFELPRDVERARGNWLIEANPFTAFLDERCRRQPDGRVTLGSLYEKFVEWAKAAGIIRPLTRPQLKQDLQHAGFTVKKSNSQVVVRGLVLKG